MKSISFKQIIDFSLLGIIFLLFCIVPAGYSSLLIWFCLAIFYYYFYCSLKQPINIIDNISSFFKADCLFMMFFYIIYFLPYQTAELGINDISNNAFLRYTYLEHTNISILASTLGLISFNIGFNKTIYIRQDSLQEGNYLFYLNLPKIITILFYLCFILYLVTGARAMFIGSYATSDVGSVTENGIFVLVNYFAAFILALSIIFYRLNIIPKNLKVAFIFVGIWSVMLLIIGDRNMFFLLAILVCSGIATYIKQISLKQISVLIAGALFLYNIIEVSRTSDVRGFAAIMESALEGGNEARIDQGSFSITTVTSRAAFAIIPEKHDYYYGKFKLIGFAGVLPYSRGLFVAHSDPYTTSSKVLKDEMIGPFAIWGVGSNIITDIYFDFGVVGILLLMFSLGYFAKYIYSHAKNNNNSVKWGVLNLLLLALYAELPRYSFDFPVRYIAWSFIIFFTYDLNYNYKKNKRQI